MSKKRWKKKIKKNQEKDHIQKQNHQRIQIINQRKNKTHHKKKQSKQKIKNQKNWKMKQLELIMKN